MNINKICPNIGGYQQISIHIIFVISLLILLYSKLTIANNQSIIDSLKNALKSAQEKDKTKILYEIADAYLVISPEKTITLSNKILKILSIKKDIGLESDVIMLKGLAYFYLNNYDKSFKYFNDALNIRKKINDKAGIASAINNIGLVYKSKKNYDKAHKFFLSALEIYKSLNNKEKVASVFYNIGTIYKAKGKYDIALEYCDKAIEIYKKIGNKIKESTILNSIANIYVSMADYQKAIEYFFASLKIDEELNDKRGIAVSFRNIGIVYEKWMKFDEAIDYYQKALDIHNRIGNKEGMATGLHDIGIIYANIGNLKASLLNFQKALKIYEKIDEKQGISVTLNNIGNVYFIRKEYDKAIMYFKKSLKINEEFCYYEGIAFSINNIGNVYVEWQKYNIAIDYYKKGLQISQDYTLKQNIMNYYLSMSDVYSITKDCKKALEYYKQYTTLKDSIFNEESHKQITEMQTKYETEKKEKEIELLNKEKKLQTTELEKKAVEIKKKNIQRNAFIAGFCLVLLLTAIVYRSYRQKKKSNRMLHEKNILISNQKEEIEQTLEKLRTTQSQLVESEKMASLGNLVAGVAHEINTPVGIGITASSALVESTKQFALIYKENKMSRKELEEYLDNAFQTGKLILSNMQRTGELVRTFKQVSVDQMTEEKRKFLLKSYLEDILFSLKPEFKGKQITTEIECTNDLEIESYPGIFAQIITNFVLNSIRHGFRDMDTGDITIIVYVGTNGASTPLSNHRSSLHIQYIDNGCGISPENLPKIFDPFFTTNKQVGTGLGLNIVYNLVTQKLKGTIKCESEIGRGAKFIIDLSV
ncbi:MAG: tetratricopeptide repeat protein [Bacteroidia bacterium]|nr:tetratricopeptide repeat protein [Bacteroidia bacterium]